MKSMILLTALGKNTVISMWIKIMGRYTRKIKIQIKSKNTEMTINKEKELCTLLVRSSF